MSLGWLFMRPINFCDLILHLCFFFFLFWWTVWGLSCLVLVPKVKHSCDIYCIMFIILYSLNMSSVCCVTEGKRYSLPNSRIMIHQPLGGAQGGQTDIDIQVSNVFLQPFILSWTLVWLTWLEVNLLVECACPKKWPISVSSKPSNWIIIIIIILCGTLFFCVLLLRNP